MFTDYLKVIVLAITQGIAEFLPISSSGHLVVLENFMNMQTKMDTTELFFFNLVIHVATLLATMLFYRKDLCILLVSTIKQLFALFSIAFKNKKNNENKSQFQINSTINLHSKNSIFSPDIVLVFMIMVTTLVTGTIGIILKPIVTTIHDSSIIGALFILNGFILLTSKLKPLSQYGLNKFTILKTKMTHSAITFALLLGIVQGLAVLPGISRSGITITTALLLGVTNREAMKYSILISIPVILGAFLLEFIEFFSVYNESPATDFNYPIYIVSSLISFSVGYLALCALYRIVKQQRIHFFSYYLFVLGGALLIYKII